MTDTTGDYGETGPFGVGAEEGARVPVEPPGDTAQNDGPSTPSTEDEAGTSYKPELLDRPLPSDEPLKVRFGKEE